MAPSFEGQVLDAIQRALNESFNGGGPASMLTAVPDKTLHAIAFHLAKLTEAVKGNTAALGRIATALEEKK